MDEGDLRKVLGEIVAAAKAIRAHGVPECDVPDVVQLCAIEAWRALLREHFDTSDVRGVRRWLYVVGQRQAVRYHRSRARAHSVLEASEIERLAGLSPCAEDLHLARGEAHVLSEVLLELSSKAPERFAVVEGYELDDRPMKDVAAELKISANTAWNRLRLGRRDLRAELRRRRYR